MFSVCSVDFFSCLRQEKFDFNEEKEKNIRKNLAGIGFIRIFATEKINQIRIFMKG